MTNRKTALERHDEQDSIKLTDEDRAIIIHLASLGFQYKRIAALFDVNMGRIAETIRQSGLKFGNQNQGDVP
jgi:DNA-directed RNA polymerase specialized sigma24 family protein